jgi:hypothetical protein
MSYNYPGFTLVHPFPEPRPKERYGYHGGADYAAKAGTPVPSMFGGTVFRSGKINGYGMAVVIRTETAQGPIYTLYGHLGRARVAAPQSADRARAAARRSAAGRAGATFPWHADSWCRRIKFAGRSQRSDTSRAPETCAVTHQLRSSAERRSTAAVAE